MLPIFLTSENEKKNQIKSCRQDATLPMKAPGNRSLWIIRLVILFFTLSAFVVEGKETPYLYPPVDAEFDSLSSELLQHEFSHICNDTDSIILNRLKRIASRSDNDILKTRYLSWEIRSCQFSFPPDSAIDLLENRLSRLPEDYAYDRAILKYQLGRNYERVGRYAKAWAALQDAVPALQEAEDHYHLGNVYLMQGLVFQDINHEKTALENLSLAENEYKMAHQPLNRVYFIKATLLNGSSPQEAAKYYKLAVGNGKKDPSITFQSYIGLAYHYLHKGDMATADHYLDLAKGVLESRKMKTPAFEMMMLTTEADLLLTKGDDQSALAILQQMENLLGKNEGDDYEPKYYRTLYEIYNRLGNDSKAFLYLKKYVNVYERQVEDMRNQEVERTKALEDIIQQQDLVARLEQKNRFTQQRLYYSIAIIALLCIIAAFIVRYFILRIRKHRMLTDKLRKDIETEKDITRLKEETMKKDIDMRTREVTSSSLHLATKNEALQQVNEIVARFAEEKKISAKSAEEIEFVIRQSLRTDDEWERFRVSFSGMHPDFINRLKQRGPSLTENDIQICAYIVMGMRPKQIAELSNISPASVNTTRYRIRKKLGLSKDESLDDYLRSLG